MSYEGREQHICENGHLFEIECRYSYDDDDKASCLYCDGHSVWCHHIDDTNGNCYGEILKEEFLKVLTFMGTFEVCNLGHIHQTNYPVYKVPQINQLQQSFMSEDGLYHPIEEYNKYYGI